MRLSVEPAGLFTGDGSGDIITALHERMANLVKILVFSDSHGFTDHMFAAVRAEKPDMVIHLGDTVPDAEDLRRCFPTLRLVNVRGNWDTFSDAPAKKLIKAEDVRILAVHGHEYAIRPNSFSNLKYAALEIWPEVQVVLFGHTHVPMTEDTFGMHFMNPGCCSDVPSPSYGVLTVDGKVVHTQIKRIK